MTKDRDAITDVVAILKREAKQPKSTAYWAKVDHDLRSFAAELNLARTEARASKDKSLPPDLMGTASVIEARELMSRASKALLAAKEFPQLLSRFAGRTYGSPGITSLPREAMKNFATALDELENCFDLHKEGFDEAINEFGNIQGSKGRLLHKLHGTPTVRFLQRFIALWHEATGREKLGDNFETAAKQLLDIGLPHDSAGRPRETGTLKRQIETAKRRGAIVETEWTRITKIMNKAPRRH